MKSNYYQTKIYKAIDNKEEAAKHSEIYLDNFEKSEFKLNTEIPEVNFKLCEEQLQSEMKVIQKEFSFKRNLSMVIVFILVLLVPVLVLMVLRNIKKKKVAEQKVADLIEEYKKNIIIAEKKGTVNLEPVKNATAVISIKKKMKF
ncbi:hypothetical protein [Flavobacterium frigoris]|uniref:Uncharacterized protein n=1 Tax=Flavobacterium frigoris TaxID=229204 RepID=A0A1H9NSF3_FLAFI|nr:hypothetical protein [Flavobacterium frigoris]SER38842.1 hypothetical protein SAMN05444355_11178 [Flavobacterium frigoris]